MGAIEEWSGVARGCPNGDLQDFVYFDGLNGAGLGDDW